MVTSIIWFTHFYRINSPLVSTPMFCLIWVYSDFVLAVSLTLLMAWASVERHILIFHQNLISTPIKRCIFHYLPLIIFTCYPLIFYFVAFFIVPCDIPFNYNAQRCGIGSCVGRNEKLSVWDSWANNIIPSFVIVIFSIALIIRVWYGKYRMGQRFQWKNYRKMTFQLLSISALYFVLYLASIILYVAYALGLSYDIGFGFFTDYTYINYFIIFLIPFVSLVSLPELRGKLGKITQLCGFNKNHVVPAISTVNTLQNRRMAFK